MINNNQTPCQAVGICGHVQSYENDQQNYQSAIDTKQSKEGKSSHGLNKYLW